MHNSVITRQKKKSVACRRCHAQKTKCSGGQPCQKCRLANCADECFYVNRDRQVKVHENYLNRLTEENRRMRDQLSLSQSPADPEQSPLSSQDATVTETDTHVQNPMLGERAWFHPYDPSTPPIYIGEAACTAFATRLRQVLTGSGTASHIPRTQYTSESALMKMRNLTLQWPSLPQARLLIQVVFNRVIPVYHLILRKSTLDQLEKVYRDGLFDDPTLSCKFFALFALGEVYSERSCSQTGCNVPGADYYVNAMALISILPERPSLAHIESLLLLSLYSYFLNRRHSAFLLVGSAMRLGLTLGLNHDIPESQCPDPVDREHRIRLWWAIYVSDRTYLSKTGWPIQIADDEVFVRMPSDVPGGAHGEQFFDTQFLIASIQLSKITGRIIENIYSRKNHQESFLQREQKLLIALKQWTQTLPQHLRLSTSGPTANNVVSLHLQFNQCIILATRPILLHTLIQTMEPHRIENKSPQQNIHQILKTLGDACIHAARYAHSLILDEWTNGTLPIFGYFCAHYLFSSALIMVVSSQIQGEDCNDFASFETAFEILRSMRDHGNLAAAEFYDNLQCVQKCLEKKRESDTETQVCHEPSRAQGYNAADTLPLTTPPISARRLSQPAFSGDYPIHTFPESSAPELHSGELPFLGQSMEEFLAQPDVDLGPLDPSGVPISVTDAVHSWPNFALWTA